MQRPHRLRLMDTYRNLFYTPIYAAVAGGFLYAEGLDVMFGTVPADRAPLDMLREGEVDIIQTGISRSLMALDEGDEDAPLHIAEINRGDGFFLVSRTPTDNWQWHYLEGATVIPIGFTPVPLTSLTAALRKHGVDIDSITMLKGLSAEDAIAAFRNGDADYIHMPNPQAQALIDDGAGYMAAALGREHGYLCYSSFAATPGFHRGAAGGRGAIRARLLQGAAVGCGKRRGDGNGARQAILRRRIGRDADARDSAVQVAWHMGGDADYRQGRV